MYFCPLRILDYISTMLHSLCNIEAKSENKNGYRGQNFNLIYIQVYQMVIVRRCHSFTVNKNEENEMFTRTTSRLEVI